MKLGFRIPSIKKKIAARTAVNRIIRPNFELIKPEITDTITFENPMIIDGQYTRLIWGNYNKFRVVSMSVFSTLIQIPNPSLGADAFIVWHSSHREISPMISMIMPPKKAYTISCPKPFPLANLVKSPLVKIGPKIYTTTRLIKNVTNQ